MASHDPGKFYASSIPWQIASKNELLEDLADIPLSKQRKWQVQQTKTSPLMKSYEMTLSYRHNQAKLSKIVNLY
jgi:hypothetical protein